MQPPVGPQFPMYPDIVGPIVALGYDIMATKYYGVAACTVLFYDHLLTLGDEIKYFWSRNRAWAFWFYIFNRYFPMTFQLWQFSVYYFPNPLISKEVCDKSAWYGLFVFSVSAVLAQVMLTARMHAITLKHLPITVGFSFITLCQLVLGILTISLVSMLGAEPVPQIPLDAYRFCVFVHHKRLGITVVAVALLYDTLMFVSIIYFATRWRGPGGRLPGLLEAITEDGTRYFLVMFISHFSLAMTMAFARESIQLLPATGVVVYLPVMISRTMVSLRKAARPRHHGWPLAEPTPDDGGPRTPASPRPRRASNTRQEDIPLESFLEP